MSDFDTYFSDEEIEGAMEFSEAEPEQIALFQELMDLTPTGVLADDIRALADMAGVEVETLIKFFQSDADFDTYLEELRP